MKLPVVLAVLIGILVLACSTVAPGPVEPTPNIDATAVVEPTLDIHATVEARLAHEQAVDATVEARLAVERPKNTTVTVDPAPRTNDPSAITPEPTVDPAPRTNDPYSVVQKSTVKVSYSTGAGEHYGSGVVVGDGQFVVTNAHVVYDALGGVEVAHYPEVGPRVVTDGSIIYVDEFVDLALIRLRDPLGPPVTASFGTPKLGEDLVIGGFPSIGGETLTATAGTVAGFQQDGLIIKFDGEIGRGNSGGPVLNTKGQLVGIVTYGRSDESAGNLGMMFSTEAFYYGLAEELLRFDETSSITGERYGLKAIGIPAYVDKPSEWILTVGLNYLDMAPASNTYSGSQLTDDYKVVGVFVANSLPGESSAATLNRLLTEFGESFERIPEPALYTPSGFDKCELIKALKEYSEPSFTRRGYVFPSGWFSHLGLYTVFCVGTSDGQKLIAYAESADKDDFLHESWLLSKISLAR